ncbi:hypothetical protein ACFLUU_06845 [Chloroflexota bacterium]
MAFSETDSEFIEEWADRWCALFDLLFETVRTDNKPDNLYSKPNRLDELRYTDLRSWFSAHESQFTPLWREYTELQNWSLDTSGDIIQEIHGAEKLLDDLFGMIYSYESLDDFLHNISGFEERHPTETEALSVAKALTI